MGPQGVDKEEFREGKGARSPGTVGLNCEGEKGKGRAPMRSRILESPREVSGAPVRWCAT